MRNGPPAKPSFAHLRRCAILSPHRQSPTVSNWDSDEFSLAHWQRSICRHICLSQFASRLESNVPVVAEIRPGAYADSVVLMQLQRALAALPGVDEAGVVMGSEANRALLAAGGLLTPEVERAGAEDLVLVIRADNEQAARAALAQVDTLLTRRGGTGDESAGYRPRTLEAAAQMLPEAAWVLVSVPGRYAAGVARCAAPGKTSLPLQRQCAARR